jgi:hypothetical protein
MLRQQRKGGKRGKATIRTQLLISAAMVLKDREEYEFVRERGGGPIGVLKTAPG